MCFRNFTSQLRQVFIGNLLLLFCSLFYLAWWISAFQPDSPDGSAGGLYLMAAFFTGIAAAIFMARSIGSLSRNSKGLPISFIWLGAAALFFLLILITTTLFHRELTSELIIIHIWAALELSAVKVLHGTSRFGIVSTVLLAVLVGLATIAGLICYVLYYRLDAASSYVTGMIPLISDAFVMAVFLSILALSGKQKNCNQEKL